MEKTLRSKVSLRNPWHFLGLGFGSGLMPFMPGTFGTIAGIPLVIACSYFGQHFYALAVLLSCVVGILICKKTADALGVHDHGSIVWDEIAGIMLTFVYIPLSWQSLLTGFVLFRLFDILKPWPIGAIDKKLDGGLGIMLDDILAGAAAWGILFLLQVYHYI